MTEPWLKKREVAERLRCSVSSIERHVKPTLRVGGQNRYLMSDVERQLRGEPVSNNVTQLPTRGPVAA